MTRLIHRPLFLTTALLLALSSSPALAETSAKNGSSKPKQDAPAPDEKTVEVNDLLTVTIKGIRDELAYQNAYNATSLNFIDPDEMDNELRLRWLFNQGKEEILTSLEPFGYYKAKVSSSLAYQGGKWVAIYNVTPGEAIPLTKVNINLSGAGNDNWLLKRIAERTEIKEGDALQHEAYEETKSKLLENALERGYFDAEYTQHEIIVDLDRYRSSVNLNLDTGERYRIRDVKFTTDYFDEEFLHRFAQFKQMSPHIDPRAYSDTKMERIQSYLNSTTYFDAVVVSRTVDHDTHEVDLEYDLKRRKQRTFMGGVGYSTDIGAKIMGAMNWHYINQYGHMLSTDLLLAQKKRDGEIRYTVPGKEPWRDFYHFYTKYAFEDTSNKDYTTFVIGAALERKRFQYTYGYALDYQHDRFRSLNGDKQRVNLIIPSIYGEWRTLSTLRFDRAGFKVDGMLRGSMFLGDVDFIQARLRGIYHLPINDRNRLILRGEIGHTFIKSEDLEKLPPSLRFYAGGDNSVRGYKYDGIGEYGYNGDVVGGKKLMVLSTELEHKLSDDFAVAGFVDAGDAFNHGKPNLKFGAGAGIRWYSPIGSVRFDIAHGFNKEFGETYRLHLTISADF